MIPFLESISSAGSCITALQNNYNIYKQGLEVNRSQATHGYNTGKQDNSDG